VTPQSRKNILLVAAEMKVLDQHRILNVGQIAFKAVGSQEKSGKHLLKIKNK